MKWRNKSLSYWLRVLHRDLGYLMVGVCLIYAVSGILLNHMNGKDPAFRTTEAAVQLEKGMQAEELLAAWNRQEDLPPVKRVLSIDESHHRLMLEGGVGVYDAASGCVGTMDDHPPSALLYILPIIQFESKFWSCWIAKIISGDF